jgi:hypothetical protein
MTILRRTDASLGASMRRLLQRPRWYPPPWLQFHALTAFSILGHHGKGNTVAQRGHTPAGKRIPAQASNEPPLQTGSSVSKSLPNVLISIQPEDGAVHRHQTEELPSPPVSSGSAPWRVASMLLPVVLTGNPASKAADSKLSLAGGAAHAEDAPSRKSRKKQKA